MRVIGNMTRCRILDTGFWILDTGYWMPDISGSIQSKFVWQRLVLVLVFVFRCFFSGASAIKNDRIPYKIND